MDTNGIDFGIKLAFCIIGLMAFGAIYNYLIERMQKRTGGPAYTAELVIGGTLITVLVSGIVIGWHEMIVVLVLFAASGFPVTLGSWVRNVRDIEAARKEMMEKNNK